MLSDMVHGDHQIIAPSEGKAREWSTALAAMGIDHRIDRAAGISVVHVASDRADAADETIEAYEKENADWPPARAWPPAEERPTYKTWAALWGPALIFLFYAWLGAYDPEIPVLRAASADAERIVSGEWWRVVTALSLHSGFVHLAGNAIFLSLFAHAVCREMGSGLGWMLILGGGIAGNTAVAWLPYTSHVAIGASTASFAALGILSIHMAVVNYRRTRSWRSIWSRTWIPLAAGLALLALLGGSEGSDVAAHVFGFLCGLLLGLPFSVLGTRWLPFWGQRLLELLSLLTVLVAWTFPFTLAALP